MASEGIKNVQNICVPMYAVDPLFSYLSHKEIIQELMHLPCICLEVGASQWRAGNSLKYEVTLEVCGAVSICVSPHGV